MRARISALAIQIILFSLPFLLGLGAEALVVRLWKDPPHIRPFDLAEMPAPPVIDPDLATAVILVSPDGTAPTGLLATYGILAASGVMNVLTVAPERVISPVWHGVDVLPHASFAGLDSLLGRPPELVFVPKIANPRNSGIIQWVQRQASHAVWLVSLGDGTHVLAEAGLLDDRNARGDFDSIGELEIAYPRVTWRQGVRWVEDEQIITSAGETSSIDVALRVIEIISGKEVSEATADRLKYDRSLHPRDVDPFELGAEDLAARYLTAAFVWDKRDIGVTVFDGVDELALGATLDLFPRVFDADIRSVGATRRVFRSRHGLDLIPWLGLDTDPKIHELIVPGEPAEADLREFLGWAAREEVPAFNPFGGDASDEFVYDAALEAIAGARGTAVARSVAKTVHYPVDQLGVDSFPLWPYDLLIIPLAFGLLGVFIFRVARKRRVPVDRG